MAERGSTRHEALTPFGYASSLKFGDFGGLSAVAAGVAARGPAGCGTGSIRASLTTAAPPPPIPSPAREGGVGWGPDSAPGDGRDGRITPAFSSCSPMPC